MMTLVMSMHYIVNIAYRCGNFGDVDAYIVVLHMDVEILGAVCGCGCEIPLTQDFGPQILKGHIW